MRSDGVAVTLRNAGSCRVPEWTVYRGGRWRLVDLPALFGLIEHPDHGIALFDTGYHPRIFRATRGFPYRLYRWILSPLVDPSETAAAQLAARGIAADAVRWVIVSHFDPDHIGGLRDFPAARVVCSLAAWRDVARSDAWKNPRNLPGHLPHDLAERLQLVSAFDGPPVGPFPGSYDLFGDHTVRLIPLPGHAPGQLGAYVQDREEQTWLLAADGCWTRDDLRRGPGPVHPRLAEDRPAQHQTYVDLQQALASAEVIVVPSHCPEAADELLAGGFSRRNKCASRVESAIEERRPERP